MVLHVRNGFKSKVISFGHWNAYMQRAQRVTAKFEKMRA